MALSTLINNIKASKLVTYISGRTGNNAPAYLADINNVVDQINIANNYTKIYYKYKTGVGTDGLVYHRLVAEAQINPYIPGSNPANKQNSPCDACTPCNTGGWSYTGKPCWKITGGSTANGCVECKAAIEDIVDGVVNGVPAKLIHLPNIQIFDPNDPFGPAYIYVEAIHVPVGYTVNFTAKPGNEPTISNSIYFTMVNTSTGVADYSKMDQIVFVQTFFHKAQGFVSPQL